MLCTLISETVYLRARVSILNLFIMSAASLRWQEEMVVESINKSVVIVSY